MNFFRFLEISSISNPPDLVFHLNMLHTLNSMYMGLYSRCVSFNLRVIASPRLRHSRVNCAKQSFCNFVLLAFLVNTFGPVPLAQAEDFHLPAPGVMVYLSPEFNPPILKGIKVHPDNPFRFDFILDKGDEYNRHPERSEGSQQEQLKNEATRLIKYFLASLTIPEKDLWVNLSPYEKNRIVPESFGQTEMGRDLLAEDYILKQITASLIYPEDEIGKKFWKRIYEESVKKFGTTNIPVNTFNKVWIVPEKAVVYENAEAGTAYIVESKLKVMLEQDYLALSKNSPRPNPHHQGEGNSTLDSPPLVGGVRGGDINSLGSQIVRANPATSELSEKSRVSLLAKNILQAIVIPQLTKEVNENKNFAQLRQVYNSLILATWYKKKIKDSILSQVYADKNKTAGVQYTSMDSRFRGNDSSEGGDDNKKNDIESIYQRYLQAFKKGVYNYIKEEQDLVTQQAVPRKYFSGGVGFGPDGPNFIGVTGTLQKATVSQAMMGVEDIGSDRAMKVEVQISTADTAMNTEKRAIPLLHKILNTPQFETSEDRYRFAGTGEAAPLEGRKNLTWLILTDHIVVNFVSREKVSKRFLVPEEIKQEGGDFIYRYTLPEDINVQETLALIRSIRNLPLSEKEKIFPQIPGKFIQTAVYLAKKHQQQMTQERAKIIRTFYALGLILGKETTEFAAPEISAIAQEKIDPALEKEITQWLGLGEEGMGDAKQLMERAAALAVQGVRIELESLTYWRGASLLKKNFEVAMPRLLNAFLEKMGFEKIKAGKEFSKLLELKKNNLVILKGKIHDAKKNFGPASKEVANAKHKAADAEIEGINSILRPIRLLIEGVEQESEYEAIFGSSPVIGRLTNEVNCVGRSALTALYLQELGIDKFWSVSVPDHVFLLAQLSDGRYFWIEPSDNPSKSRIASLPSGIDTIPPKGISLDLKEELGFNYVMIEPWRNGIEGGFFMNLGGILRKTKDYEGAIAAYQKAIELNPNYTFAYNSLGSVLNDMGRHKKAIAAYQKAIELNPNYTFAYNNLGIVLTEIGRNEEAIAEYKKVIKLNPKDADAYNNLGIVLNEIGGNKKSISKFLAELKSNPELTLPSDILKLIKGGSAQLFQNQSKDHAMNAAVVTRNGGIDLTPANMNLKIKMDSRRTTVSVGQYDVRGNDRRSNGNDKGIQFHLDPAQLAQFQNTHGFVPVIINIQPMNDLKGFLGISADAVS